MEVNVGQVIFDSYDESHEQHSRDQLLGGRVVNDITVDRNQNGRLAGSFKDGTYIRVVEVDPGNVICFKSVEGQPIYWDGTINTGDYSNFVPRTISAEHSSFNGAVVLILGGFTADTGNSRTVIILTDYVIKPEVVFQGNKLAGETAADPASTADEVTGPVNM
jgi:hypothetical protein